MSGDTLLTLTIEEVGETLRASVLGELDMHTEPKLIGAFREAIDGTKATASVLDLRQVGFVDSSGLRGLLRCRDHATSRGIGFSLAVDEGPVTRLLDVTGVKTWFTYA